MSRDFNNVSSDLSWLASSSFLPSVAQLSSLPKTYDAFAVNNIEPWESLTNINQVRRNLNKSWITKPVLTRDNETLLDNCNLRCISTNIPENMSFSTSKELYPREPFILNVENKQPQCWSYFENTVPSNPKEMRTKSSIGNLNNNNSSFNECAINSVHLNNHRNPNLLNQFSLNLEHMNPEYFSSVTSGSKCGSLTENLHEEKKIPDKLSVPITPLDSLSPSTCSGTPPKLNADLIALMQELALISCEEDSVKFHHQNVNLTPFQSPPPTPLTTPTKGCVFCKNNSYHSTFYKSHVLKDDNGHCKCPVLRTYICPLCGGTGDFAHTLKYCPRNTVTKGDPIAAGLPPGKVTNWREVATKMAASHRKH